jgi:hypothetical protein
LTHYDWRSSVNNHPQLQFDPSVTVFTPENWDTQQTVQVLAIDDSVAELPCLRKIELLHSVFSVDPQFKNNLKWFMVGDQGDNPVELDSGSVACGLTDDDRAGIAISEGVIRVHRGGTPVQYSIHLESQPIADVTVTLSHQCRSMPETSQQVKLDKQRIFFTSKDWNQPQTVAVTGHTGMRNCEFRHCSPQSHVIDHGSSSDDPAYGSDQDALLFSHSHLHTAPALLIHVRKFSQQATVVVVLHEDESRLAIDDVVIQKEPDTSASIEAQSVGNGIIDSNLTMPSGVRRGGGQLRGPAAAAAAAGFTSTAGHAGLREQPDIYPDEL